MWIDVVLVGLGFIGSGAEESLMSFCNKFTLNLFVLLILSGYVLLLSLIQVVHVDDSRLFGLQENLVCLFGCGCPLVLLGFVSLYVVGVAGRVSAGFLLGACKPVSRSAVGFIIAGLDNITCLLDLGNRLGVSAIVYLFIFSGLFVGV